MGAECSYRLSIDGLPDNVDIETLMFHAGRIAPETKRYLNDLGESTGNEGPWDTIVSDFLAISAHYEDTTFYIHEAIQYDGEHQAKYKFHSGRYKMIEPELKWPEFETVQWS